MTDSDEVKLLPCPTPWCQVPSPYLQTKGDIFRVFCTSCGVATDLFRARYEAIEQWSTRPPVVTDEVVERVVFACRQSLQIRMPLHVSRERVDEVARDVGIAALNAAIASMPAVVSGGQSLGAFNLGDLVQKKGRASWRGKVVGSYQTELTELGYAVESSFEPGSVQIYPESALLPWDGASQPEIGE